MSIKKLLIFQIVFGAFDFCVMRGFGCFYERFVLIEGLLDYER